MFDKEQKGTTMIDDAKTVIHKRINELESQLNGALYQVQYQRNKGELTGLKWALEQIEIYTKPIKERCMICKCDIDENNYAPASFYCRSCFIISQQQNEEEYQARTRDAKSDEKY